jgi:acetyltransferase-like isoleucine patch superfamily enzyme
MIVKNIRHRLRLLWTNLKVASRADVLIERGVTIKYSESIRFGGHVTLQSGVYLYGSRTGREVVLEDGVTISGGCMILGEGGIALGAYTHLGPRVVVTSQFGDDRGPMATATPHIKTMPIRLGKGCWIGSGSVIMPGAQLGDECVVAPLSVVYGRWPARARLMGNPARRMAGDTSPDAS